MPTQTALNFALAHLATSASFRVSRYQANELAGQDLHPVSASDGSARFSAAGAEWSARLTPTQAPGQPGAWDIEIEFSVVSGTTCAAAVGLQLDFADWSTCNHVFMPAGVYAGNRFATAESWEPNKSGVTGGLDMPTTITKQQRLNHLPGPSGLHLLSGDLTTPALGLRFAEASAGFLLLFTQKSSDATLGNLGIELSETLDRSAATFRLQSPAVRPGHFRNGKPRTDRGHVFKTGDRVSFRLRLVTFPAPDTSALFEAFFNHRHDLTPATARRHMIPTSSVWDIQEDKYNRQNWVEEYGYYSVGMRECPSQDWQTAWVGGMNTVLALLLAGTPETQARARRNFDFLFDRGIHASGYFRALFSKGEWLYTEPLLQRYSGDALYFILREFTLLEKRDGFVIPPAWLAAARGCADALLNTWRRFGQWGHRIDGETGVVQWGGTCCASTACGALALASQRFNEPRYLNIAAEAGVHFHDAYLAKGYTTAGPGDIIQCPDSESAFGLLEGYMALHEVTREARWIAYARRAAHLCASWVVTYDYAFPAQSTFGRLDMRTTGTVWASIQNKHSAPGICTLSGLSLLQLFRATGERPYLRLLSEIVHAIPQFMSRADRPITDRRPGQPWPVMDPGWINERVNMSDWEVRADPDNEIGVGEIFGGSTWAEPAMMLSHTELPGLYVQPDTGLLEVLDHVDARVLSFDGERVELEVTNPTTFPANLKLLCETAAQAAAGPLPAHRMHDLPRLAIAPGATAKIVLTAHIF